MFATVPPYLVAVMTRWLLSSIPYFVAAVLLAVFAILLHYAYNVRQLPARSAEAPRKDPEAILLAALLIVALAAMTGFAAVLLLR